MSSVNWIKVAQAAKQAASECIAGCRRAHPGAHFTQRHVEILAIDEQGERIGDPLVYLTVKELSGKALAQVVHDRAPARYAYITVQGGVDGYDSFQDAMAYPDDYDPGVDWWAVDTSDSLPTDSERVPLAECGPAAGPGVAQRIEQQTIRQRATGTHGSQHREIAAQCDEAAGAVLQRLASREV